MKKEDGRMSYSDLFESWKEMYFALLTLSVLQVCRGLSLEILGSSCIDNGAASSLTRVAFLRPDSRLIGGCVDKMSRDVITVGLTMRILLLYRGEYSQWHERFMNYLEEQTNGEAMINSIQNEKKNRKVDRLARSLLIQGISNDIYSLIDNNETAKDLWDALERQMRGSEYGEQDRKAAILSVITRKTTKAVVVTSDPLALVAEKTKVSKRKEKVVVSSDSEGSGEDDFSELKKITALLEKAFNRRKFYSKPTNNNLRTSPTSQFANKKQDFVKSGDKKVEKKDDEKKRDVITPGMFKLSVSQTVSPISMSKTSCESNNVENLDTFSNVKRSKNSDVIWKKKGSSNTSNVDLSIVSLSKLNKNVKRYCRKNLLSCNNSHLGETSSAYVCNDAMNVFCNSRMNDFLDDNNFFIFDDESVRISVSKMTFRKKPCDSMNIVQICLWIIDSGCSKHMTGNCALLTNFVEKFLGTVRFGNNDFAVIAGYGDVVI
nr:integrase, catalytic region, zinc finger, CCHC-type, peptidase aspartic, catalytic [Tanacetum cinerariifolium]